MSNRILQHPKSLAALCCAALCTTGSAFAQCGEQHELMPVPAPTGDQFGLDLDATETQVFVSATGGLRVHIFDAGSLVQQATILAPVSAAYNFGKSLDADGTRLLVGAPDHDSVILGVGGRAFLYDSATFSLDVEVLPSGPFNTLRLFGERVAVHGDLAAVTGEEDGATQRTGVVRLFSLEPAPLQLARIEGLDEEHHFGNQLALSDEYLCIGGNNRVVVHDAATQGLIGEISLAPYPGSLTSLALVEDRVFVGMNGRVLAFDVNTQAYLGLLTPSYKPGQNGGYGKRIAVGGGTLATARVAVTRPVLGSAFLFEADSFDAVERYVSSYSAGAPSAGQLAPLVALNSTRLFAAEAGHVVAYDLNTPCERTTFCYGDGEAFVPCLCGNESDPADREGCRNSTGRGAALRANGSASIVADDLQLQVEGGPAGKPGVFVQGATAIATTFSDGVLCMGNPTQRLEFAFFDGAGQLSSAESIRTNGNVSIPGTTRFYQLWYRDPIVSPCGTGANLTNGVRVDWI